MAIAVSIEPQRQAQSVCGTLAVPAARTPILRLLRAWEDLNNEAEAYVMDDVLGVAEKDALYDRLFYDRIDEIARELMTLRCTCAADFAAKLIISSVKGTVFQDWEAGEIWTEARALTGLS